MSLKVGFIQPMMGLDPEIQYQFEECDKKEVTKANIDDKQDDDGNTRLHLAAQRASKCMIVYLLNRGASTNIRNKEGWKAIHMVPKNQPGLRVLFFS